MSPMEGIASLLEWAGPNLAHDLEFIPDDRLHWKPAPNAKSAMECAVEATYFTRAMIDVVNGGAFEMTVPESPTKGQVQEDLRRFSSDYASALRRLSPERLAESVETPFGTFPLGRLAAFPVVDVIHHRGQVCYLQTMLGDTENHFLA